jgi:signal transduction histidine kinase
MLKLSATDMIANPPEPLEIGLGVLDKSGNERSRAAAARKLVRQALHGIDTNRLPVRCALLLATADWCHTPSSIPREVRRALRKTLGYQVPLIGGSMARLFCSTLQKGLIEHGLILVLHCSSDLWVTVASLGEPYKATEAKRKTQVRRLAKNLRAKAGIRLGASAARHLLGVFPGIFLNKQGEQVYYDNELHGEILAAFGYQFRLIGGAAADDLKPTVGYQFADDKCLKSGLALAMVETDLAWGTMMGHGFIPDRDASVSVDALKDGRASGYEISRLDGKPATDRARELARASSWKAGQMLLGLPDGPDHHLVCALNENLPSSGCLRLNRKVRRGQSLCLLKADGPAMKRKARAVIQGAISNTRTRPEHIKLIWGLSCTGRFDLYCKLGVSWEGVITELRKLYTNAIWVSGLCAGEFGIDKWRRSENNNFSFWASCMASAYAPRADTRLLQKKLLAAAECLSTCRTPKEVMQSALKGAVECGTTGGQICLVDSKIGRILGLHLGHALSRPGSGQNWSAVAALTDRPAPKAGNGRFPRYLLNYSLPVGQSQNLRVVRSLSREEDILTLIVRTGQAIFVADCTNPLFHCERKAAKAGDIFRFLAIPLLGSDNRAIATLQLGFPDHFTLNRESFGLWVGYAQKVAAALERAQEAQERTIREQISALGNRIMQTPFDPALPQYEWCDKFLGEVIHLVGAHGAHVRLLSESISKKQEFRLVSAVGHLAKLRFRTRPVTHNTQGSCNLNLLRMEGGRVTHTKEQTAKLNRNVRAVGDQERHGDEFLRGLAEIQSTAMLPLKYGETILGSFVVDGLNSYLFTARNERIARAAADLAGTILCRKKADRDLLELDDERSLVFETLVSATHGTADHRLRKVLEHLCSALQADVASVFVWHETEKQLVLHTAHNWHILMEGKANYALDQGWTGSIATSAEHVSIVCPGVPGGRARSRRYYKEMVPPAQRSHRRESEPRVGVRLMAGDQLVGVVTLAYYRSHATWLKSDHVRTRKLLDVLRHLITLSVEAAKREATEGQIRRLLNVRNTALPKLMGEVEDKESWLDFIKALREGFQVERASFYPVRNEHVESGWTATSADWSHTVGPFLGSDPVAALQEVVVGGQSVAIRSPSEDRLAEWPNHEGVRALYAVPVFSSQGAVAGVLEFVNRIPDQHHPFEYFDSYEQGAAAEVARSLGPFLDRRHAIDELRNQLEIARRIGATSLAGAIVMHYRMSPLARLRSGVDWLARHPDCSRDDLAKCLDQVRADCSEAIETIQQAASGAPGKQRVDLRTLLTQALQTVLPHLANADVKLDVCNEMRFPLEVDAFCLVGALVNLLSNAIEASPAGGVVRVTTEQALPGTEALVRIINPGRNYTKQELDDFFTPGRTTKGSRGHLGLGLAISRRAVEASGGSLDLKPPDSGGVEAWITLPLALQGGLPQAVKTNGEIA